MVLQQVLAAYQTGNWQEAERLCRLMLGANPAHFDALHLLGIIAAQTRRLQEAVDFLSRAAAVEPNNAEVQNSRGNVLRELGRNEEALQCYERALQLNRKYAEAHNNRATVLQRLGRLEDALGSYDRALKLRPGFAEAHSNRATALQDLGRCDEALKGFDRALRIDPRHAPAHYNRGNVLRVLRRNVEAVQSYDQALQWRPDYAEALNNRGNALRELGRFAEALDSYDRALQINHESPDVHNSRGIVLKELRRHDDALQSFDAALQINPEYAEAWGNRGSVLQELRRYEEALPAYERALQIKADCEFVYGQQLYAERMLCRWSDLTQQVAVLSRGIEAGLKISEPFGVLSIADAPALQRKVAEIWAQKVVAGSGGSLPPKKYDRHPKIRIGYFSADFHEHPVASLTAALFETHDRSQFEWVAFSFGPDTGDAMRRRLERAFDRFVDVQKMTDEDIVALARGQEIDIAVDLGGFTQGARPGIFARRAAPVQVNFLGYPGTLGAAFMDYLVADTTIIPEHSRPFYAEKIAYLPSYQPNDPSRPIADRVFTRSEMHLPDNGFVFCCFNNQYKILPSMFEIWMRILKQVDGSVLWLSSASDAARDNLRAAASRCGIVPERLVFAQRLSLAAEHLARHRLADLFIDTLPYNAHTTVSDALWAGLPVLTCAGEAFAGRVAASALTAVGLPELITASLQEYETKAVELAATPELLGRFRRRLAENRLRGRLFDLERYARSIENAYVQMIERSQAGVAAENIFVNG
jgi:predicted O-linked N-acetylglucosamine transferase (SPINDLY family)